MTVSVPTASASGTFRPGSRISSATYAAAFQPEYVNITGTSASSHASALTGPATVCRFDADPLPIVRPSTMKITNADTFNVVSTLPTTRPGPTPRTCTQHSAPMMASATS